MSAHTYDLYFTGKDDPRDGCIIIGDGPVRPIYYEFVTQVFASHTRTTIYRNSGEIVAHFDWSSRDHLGYATIGNRQLPMSDLVLPGSSMNARMFSSADGRMYEWRKSQNDPTSYDLYATPNLRIAVFRRFAQATPVGPAHSLFQYSFTHDPLLLEALLALAVNRWIDWRGM